MAIYLEDRGAPFFLQERCGLGGKTFNTIKFRTMKLPEKGIGEHRVIYFKEDPRVTKVGKILRVTALDELPGLINILKGEMSFVGPRPLPFRVESESRYRTLDEVPGYELRSKVRPGLTGIAQVYAPKNIDRRNKFRYDNIYVKKQSSCLDSWLILQSIVMALKGKWD
jgi:lipopolysaccharide/colanic/teichoic acid biosynthesis glycosyltransferase